MVVLPLWVGIKSCPFLIWIFLQVFDVPQPPLAEAVKIGIQIHSIFEKAQGPWVFYVSENRDNKTNILWFVSWANF